LSHPVTLPPAATWHALVESALAEDLGPGDVTTRLVIPAERTGRARIEARQELVVCGVQVVSEVFRQVDPDLEVTVEAGEGARVGPGASIALLSGRVRSILEGERSALNFFARTSGIATFTRRFVEAVQGTGTQIVDTRKTLPGWRMLDKYAVAVGGGVNHRIGLFDGILLKDNHIAAAGGIGQAVAAALALAPANLRVQVEVESLDQAREACDAGADFLLLDNRKPDEIRAIHEALGKGILLEASGGIDLESVRSYAESGVQRISIGALTHSAAGVDVALEMLSIQPSGDGGAES
jgi:nicotinate-nucleotide pyrophosphorylase (carboxylating)